MSRNKQTNTQTNKQRSKTKQRLCIQLAAYKVHQSIFGDDRFFKSFLKRKRLADFRSSLIAFLVAIKVKGGFHRFNFKSIINRYCKQKRNAMAKEVLERKTFDPSES